MAYSVVWSPNALDDVDEIAAYITRDSPTYAAAVVEKILDITRNL
jgi:toxin ParE1/3/4